MSQAALFWTFNAAVVLLLALDLGFLHRGTGATSLKQALAWTAFWVGLAMGFAALLLVWRGTQPFLEFLTGYLIEGSLSLDNLFLFLAIFSVFQVPRESQYRVLFWGVTGAIVTRAAFIFAGIALLRHFGTIVEYAFGGFLIYTGFRMLRGEDRTRAPRRTLLERLARRLIPFAPEYSGSRFFVRTDDRWRATPLLLVLLAIETTDIALTADSIPAVLAVTRDAVIVYTSNIFAVLGLRALYFALSGAIERFALLKYGLCAILVFIGAKMIASPFFVVSVSWTLAAIGGILTISILGSMKRPASGLNGGSHHS